MRSILTITLFLSFLFAKLGAQTTTPLSWTDLRQQVLQQHPAARNADLLNRSADASLLRARGGFDPKLFADLEGKEFKDKTYYQYSTAGIKWPSWLGLEFKSTYSQVQGQYLNPESTLPSKGQLSAGFTWSLGQGLLMDERRAGLRQAQIGLDQARFEQHLVLNDLLLDAAKAYWTWVLAENQLQVIQAARIQAIQRHQGILESYRQGDKPAIDTLETFIQVQNRSLDANFAAVDAQNAAVALTTFYWTDAQTIIEPAALPQAPDLEQLAAALPAASSDWSNSSNIQEIHPAVQWYKSKLQILEIERRLKQEKRKPVLDLNYNLLGNGWAFFPTDGLSGPAVLVNDIKWGLNFSYPILNRKARGDWQITQVKMNQTSTELEQKRQLVGAKVAQYTNELKNLRTQTDLYRDISNNYKLLLDAEMEKFQNGESSVFLINTREQRWLDARIKYLKLLSEFFKTEAGLNWAAGRLGDSK